MCLELINFAEALVLSPKNGPWLQGINSGVALLNLEKMRKSDTFNKYLENDFIGSLCQKYLFKGFIGDQVRCIVISSLYLIIYF